MTQILTVNVLEKVFIGALSLLRAPCDGVEIADLWPIPLQGTKMELC